MCFISTIALLASLAAGTLAEVGSFETFTDWQCSKGSKRVRVPDNCAEGHIATDVEAVKAHLPYHNLRIYGLDPETGISLIQTIGAGNSECRSFPASDETTWSVDIS